MLYVRLHSSERCCGYSKCHNRETRPHVLISVSELVSWAESFRQQTSCWAEVLHVSRTNPCILLDLSPLQTIYACENRDVMDDVSLKEFYKKIHEQKTSDEWMREAQAIAIELSQLDAHTILSHERCMQISATLEALDTIPVKESEELRVAVEELRRVLSDGLNRYMHRIG